MVHQHWSTQQLRHIACANHTLLHCILLTPTNLRGVHVTRTDRKENTCIFNEMCKKNMYKENMYKVNNANGKLKNYSSDLTVLLSTTLEVLFITT